MPCGILHPMVWDTSMNSLALILKTIYLFLPCKLIFWKVGSPPNFPKLMSQLLGIPQPQYFVTSLLEPHQTYFWKHYIYHKKDTKVGSQNLATKFGFVPDCILETDLSNYIPQHTWDVVTYPCTKYLPSESRLWVQWGIRSWCWGTPGLCSQPSTLYHCAWGSIWRF